MILIFIF